MLFPDKHWFSEVFFEFIIKDGKYVLTLLNWIFHLLLFTALILQTSAE